MGKGCYPIFAIMSHHCICNARYFVDPRTFNMYVRARVAIKAGEEITVQYLSALNGTHRWPGNCNGSIGTMLFTQTPPEDSRRMVFRLPVRAVP